MSQLGFVIKYVINRNHFINNIIKIFGDQILNANSYNMYVKLFDVKFNVKNKII